MTSHAVVSCVAHPFALGLFIAALLSAPHASAQSHCVINEIMYAPAGGEPEWVEIFNPAAQSFNLKNWKVRDLTATRKTITTKDAVIAPGGYLVLAHDTTILNYHDVIPANVVALSLPSLNNDSDAVIIYDATGAIVDSLVYHASWGGANGTSIERVRSAALSTAGSNWRSSRDIERSTPGRRNSVAPKPIDAALDTLTAQALGGNQFQITAQFHNEGEQDLANVTVRFAVDRNNDSLIGDDEIIADVQAGGLPATGSAQASASTPRLLKRSRVLSEVIVANDGDTSNNARAMQLSVSHAPRCVVINEIMYAPAAPEPEWVELQNRSSDTIDCTDWRISTGSAAGTLGNAPVLGPGEYLVVARDTDALAGVHPDAMPHCAYAALPTLSNSGGKVMIFDDAGTMIDSVAWKPAWGGASGMSLERVDSSGSSVDSGNWGQSVDSARSTCARRNSIARRQFDVCITGAHFTPDSSAVELMVHNLGLQTANDVVIGVTIDSVALHNARGDVAMSIPAGSISPLTLPVGALPVGNNNITVAARFDGDERPENNAAHLRISGAIGGGRLAINEIMYAPRTGAPEYVELVNRGHDTMDLLGCALNGAVSPSTHHADTMFIAPQPAILAPGEYAVIAADTTVYAAYGLPREARVLVQHRHDLGLANDSGVIVITDARGIVCDSVHYASSWHSPNVKSTTGISLEKLNPLLTSTARGSWASSVAALGGTPCARNSIFTMVNVTDGSIVQPPSGSLSASPNPVSPDGDGIDDFTVIRFTLPFDASTYALHIYTVAGRSVRELVNVGRAAREGTVVWDGRDDGGVPVPLGVYVAVMDAADAQSGTIIRLHTSVIVARVL